MDYHMPSGLHAIPHELLDLRPDAEIDEDILHPRPVKDDKNVWFFWHSGFANIHGYTKRIVRTWHRRFSKLGWTIRVMNMDPESDTYVGKYLDLHDGKTFPRAFRRGSLAGHHSIQHISDLVRFPLLLKYGGIYADVGVIQIGDLDRLWNETIANPDSPIEIISNLTSDEGKSLTNYFFGASRGNAMFDRCHRLLLTLWDEDGGKDSTDGMHASPLVKGVPMMGKDLTWEEDGRVIAPPEGSQLLTDYIIQGQVMIMVMGLIDEEGDWNGPEYCSKHIWATDFIVGSQLINDMTAWNGYKQFELMSLHLPKSGEAETADQTLAREIVENCLRRSFGFKLATGLILRVFGDTLSSLWRKNDGSDNVPGTYAHWFRHGTLYWCADELPPNSEHLQNITVWKRGPLLREA